MAYTTRIANPRNKKKSAAKRRRNNVPAGMKEALGSGRGQLLTKTEAKKLLQYIKTGASNLTPAEIPRASALHSKKVAAKLSENDVRYIARYGTKKFRDKLEGKSSSAKRSRAKRSAVDHSVDLSAGKSTKKKSTKKKSTKKKSTKKKSSAAAVRVAGAKAMSESALIAHLDELRDVCKVLTKRLKKGGTTPRDRAAMIRDLKRAMVSAAGCKTAAYRWADGADDLRKRKAACTRTYGPRGVKVDGPKTLGKYSRLGAKGIKVPSMDNKGFWGD